MIFSIDRVRGNIKGAVFAGGIAFVLLLLAPPAIGAAAPSFDCSTAATEIDKTICSNNELAALDRDMGEHFNALLALQGTRTEALQSEQRQWLAARNACFTAGQQPGHPVDSQRVSQCLGHEYQRRISHFSTSILRHAMADPVSTAKALRHFNDLRAKMSLALVDRIMLSQEGGVTSELKELLDQIAERTASTPGVTDIGGLDSYDGSIGALVPYLQATSLALDVDGFVIPCAFVERAPDLVHAADPVFGSTRDSFLPQVDCQAKDFPLPDSVGEYFRQASRFDGGFRDRCTGTMAFGYARAEYLDDLIRRVTPRLLLTDASMPWAEHPPTLDHLPLEVWSYQGLWNRQAFLDLEPIFLQARSDLAAHYRQRFGMTETEALEAAHRAIWIDMFEGWWRKWEPDPVRKAILDGKSVEDIEAARRLAASSPPRESGSNNPSRYIPNDPSLYIREYAGEPDSLLMIAVTRPEVVDLLIRSGEDVNGRNAFGKTPLMMAAQYDALASARMLLAAGADPKAATREPREIPGNDPINEHKPFSGCGLYAIAYGHRTALMYAAADASLPMIELLVASGADRAAKDSKGNTALEYLLGKGPVPANPKLSGDDLAKAQHLLLP